ncbi:MAG: restriction endonuclease subunit S [Proteobacteria bacterium]|nr:restriction endonuclease subunit S [Pseudomonadota bacterium]
MRIGDLFNLYQGNGFELINMSVDNNSDVNFVARTSENNGVVARVARVDKKPFPAGAISVAVGGSVLSSFVQDKQFYTGFHVLVLMPKSEMSLEEKLFYCHAIKMNAYRYSYGRQANKTLKNINLPPLPKWLKDYKIGYAPIITNVKRKDMLLDVRKWEHYYLSCLFDVSGTKTTKVSDLETFGAGKFPYITTQSTNNGVAGFYDYFTEKGNVLVIDSAVAGFCSYQEMDFSASDHVEKLSPKFQLNKYIGLFISSVINMERYRYSYGRKFNQIKIRDTKIKLPADATGSPDWAYMESYIKSLPHSDNI